METAATRETADIGQRRRKDRDAGVGRGERYVDAYGQLPANYALTSHITLALKFAHLSVGPTIASVGRHVTDYLATDVHTGGELAGRVQSPNLKRRIAAAAISKSAIPLLAWARSS